MSEGPPGTFGNHGEGGGILWVARLFMWDGYVCPPRANVMSKHLDACVAVIDVSLGIHY